MQKRVFTFLFIFVILQNSFAQTTFDDILSIMQSKCIACHNQTTISGNLDLTLTASNTRDVIYTNLVNANASNSTAIAKQQKRVSPGDPYRSFLFRKINNGLAPHIDLESTEGVAMPENESPLTKRERELIRQWIFKGAPSTGNVVNKSLIDQYYDTNDNIIGVESMPLSAVPTPPATGQGFQLHVGPFFIPANGEDEVFLKYKLNLPEDIEIRKFSNHFSQYSHHLILYKYTDDTYAENSVQAGFRANTSQPNNAVIGEAVQAPIEIELPLGTAFKWQASNWIDLNSHYINYDQTKVLAAEAYVNIYTQPLGTAVQEMYSELMNCVNIVLFPGQTRTISQNQTWSGDRYFWAMTSHTHARGQDFNVYRRDTNEKIFDAECYTTGSPGASDCISGSYDYKHPPTRYWNQFLKINGSTGIKQEAIFTNNTASLITFGLTSDDEMMITMPMWVNDTTGLGLATLTGVLNDTKESKKITAFPNPAHDVLYFDVDAIELGQQIKVSIKDVQGKEICSNVYVSNKQKIAIDIKAFNSGIYFYSIQNNNGIISNGRFVKQ
jgi:hypothetical protein